MYSAWNCNRAGVRICIDCNRKLSEAEKKLPPRNRVFLRYRPASRGSQAVAPKVVAAGKISLVHWGINAEQNAADRQDQIGHKPVSPTRHCSRM
jgi:hypothetical protein